MSAGFKGRPRHLKVFINPSSHKKEAVHIYREHVAPLFKMADIRTDITGQHVHEFIYLLIVTMNILCLGRAVGRVSVGPPHLYCNNIMYKGSRTVAERTT